ncbi:hypothetical protein chiPu_0029733, partial [Chiloscyllium punctatum]|nr:hypothetical protein [Chiloscyllium punctatum]
MFRLNQDLVGREGREQDDRAEVAVWVMYVEVEVEVEVSRAA